MGCDKVQGKLCVNDSTRREWVRCVEERMLSGKFCMLNTNQFCLYKINCQGECFEVWKERRNSAKSS